MHLYISWLRNKFVIAGVVILVLIVGIALWKNISNSPVKTNLTTDSKCPASPQFTSILPQGKSIKSLGGWKPLCPPDSAPTYVYSDVVDDVSVSVSEQPLPASLRDNPAEQVTDLAKKSNYSNTITAGDTTVYVGTSAQGPQSAMLTKKGLLVLIKSTTKISDAAWSNYVQSLR